MTAKVFSNASIYHTNIQEKSDLFLSVCYAESAPSLFPSGQNSVEFVTCENDRIQNMNESFGCNNEHMHSQVTMFTQEPNPVFSDEIADVTVSSSDLDTLSDISMDDELVRVNDVDQRLEDHDCRTYTEDSVILTPRSIFGNVVKKSNILPSIRLELVHNTTLVQRSYQTHHSSEFIEEDFRWTTYQEINFHETSGPTNHLLSSYEQAIQECEQGLTTIPQCASLKHPTGNGPQQTTFQDHHKPSRHQESDMNTRRSIILDRKRSDSCCSCSVPSLTSIQSYHYFSPCVHKASANLSFNSRKKLKSCLKSSSHGELSTTKLSVASERDVSVSFNPNVSVYDLGRTHVKYTSPGWSKIFT